VIKSGNLYRTDKASARFTIVLKHRASLARGPIFLPIFIVRFVDIEQLVDHHILEITLYTSGVKCSDTYPGVLPSDGL
jgi:hypothetical protein